MKKTQPSSGFVAESGLYLWLLIFEGALRKWIVPQQLSGIVATIRDPVAIYIYWFAYQSPKIRSPYFTPIAIVGLMMTILAAIQVTLGVASVPIVLFGLRSYVLHLPLIYVMQTALTSEDIRKIGRFFLLLSAPMTILMALQFRAGQDDWLNNGAGGAGGQITGALGHIRAAGTFSFVTGVSEFFPIVDAFVIAGFLERKTKSRKLLIVAVCSALIAIPISISRTMLFTSGVVAVTALVAAGRRLKSLVNLAALIFVVAISAVVLVNVNIVGDSITAFQARWESAKVDQLDASTSDLLGERVLAPLISAFEGWQTAPLIGQGIGLGSNFASSFTTGSLGFLLGETEWVRLVQEAGPIVGLTFIFYLVALSCQITYLANKVVSHSILPLLLAAATVPNLLFNVMEQPTNLGFMIFGSGVALAAARQCRTRAPYRFPQRNFRLHQRVAPQGLTSPPVAL